MSNKQVLRGLKVALLIVPAVLFGNAGSASASTSCGSVVKKIYSITEGPPLYKAKVTVTNGAVECSEARRIIWRVLKPGGFNGGFAGWQCASHGASDPFIEQCSRAEPAATIRSSKPRPCASCSRTLKMAWASSKGTWQKCGRVHFAGNQFLRVEAESYPCSKAMPVARGLISEMRRGQCETAVLCIVGDFRCPLKGPNGALRCHNSTGARVRLRAIH